MTKQNNVLSTVDVFQKKKNARIYQQQFGCFLLQQFGKEL